MKKILITTFQDEHYYTDAIRLGVQGGEACAFFYDEHNAGRWLALDKIYTIVSREAMIADTVKIPH